MSKQKIGVLFGGMSTEHDVSVVSGTSVIKNLNQGKYEILPIYIDKDGDLKARLRYATRIIPLWQDEEHEILDAIIMTYDVEVYTSETEREKKTKVEYWDLDGVRYLIYDGETLIEDVEEVEKRNDLVIGKDIYLSLIHI